jgi:NADH dehydrogenase
MVEENADGKMPRVVIVGAGFGGLACAKELGGSSVAVTVVDRRNYHLFVPLLYQVATAALSPADIARPIRRILGKYRNIDVVLGEAIGLDAQARILRLADGTQLPYDRLVVATGSDYSYFGHPEWAKEAPGPRTLEDARRIRARLLTAFERAESAHDPAERDVLMTTVIVGGGPTGVEMAGAVAELTRHALARDFHHIDPTRAPIILVEAGPRILSSFPQVLSDYAMAALKKLGITVLTGQAVEAIDARGVRAGGRDIAAGTVIWGAGIQASPAGRWLGAETDRAGRICIGPDLAVRGLPHVYAMGDTALAEDEAGKSLPALAQVAKQQGEYLGRALAREFAGKKSAQPFRFHNRGNTAIIGRHAAVFDFGWWKLKGRLAWLLWALIHVYLLIGFDNRIRVTVQWIWLYLTYERGARLVMSDGENAPPRR